MPAPTVQVLLDDGTNTWQHDVTAYVRMVDGITINRGRQDEFADVQPSTCTLTLDNTAGTFKPTTVEKPNLLGNASFEVDTTGWAAETGVTGIAQTSAQAYVGSKSLAITFASGGGTILSHPFPVDSTRRYGVMARFRAATAGQSTVLGISFYDAAGALIASGGGVAGSDNTGVWQNTMRTPITPPAGAVTGRVAAGVFSSAAGEVHYLDAVYAAAYAFTGADTYTAPLLPTGVDTGVRVRVTVNGVTTNRFTGFIGGWPTTWPGGGEEFATATVTATDRLPRLARRKLRSVLENEVLSVRPKFYYLLSEGTGATTAGDTSGGGQAAATVATVGSGGAVDFGAGTGPRTDGHTATTFTPTTISDYSYLTANIAGLAYASSFWVRVAVSTAVSTPQVFVKVRSSTEQYVQLGTNASGFLYGQTYLRSAGDSVTLGDGLVHDCVAVFDYTADKFRLYKDGALIATTTLGSAGLYDLRPVTLRIGSNGVTSSPTQGSLSHVAYGEGVPSAAQIADWYAAGADGFTTDSSDERVARIARYARIDTADQVLEAGDLTSVAASDTDGATPVDAMQRVARSEQGLLFIDGSGRLAFHARSHRYTPTIGVTLDASDVDPSTSLSRDTQGLINSATATRPGGATQTFEDATSLGRYEQYPTALDLLVTTDDEALQAAAWVVSTHAEPMPRVPAIPVDLMTATATLAAQVQALDLGSALTLSGLPSQAEASSLSVFAEGWSETISAAEWTQTFNTSPLITVWTLEDPVSGVIDSTFRLAY